jgi:acid phosphatase family membrane protein YuiD
MLILRQYLFLIPVVVMVLSELTKAVVEYARTGKWHAGLFRTGGMPSSHSAFVTSLLIIVERKTGMQSLEFAMAFVFAAVVWYDAVSLRREVGLQAEMLNRLQQWQHFTERVGHSIKEVVAGIIFGTAVTYVGIWIS